MLLSFPEKVPGKVKKSSAGIHRQIKVNDKGWKIRRFGML